MRVLACLLLLLAVPAVQAQMYKCVDQGGKTRYSDKPFTDCKSTATIAAPPKPSDSKSGAPAAKKGPPLGAKLPPGPGLKGAAPKKSAAPRKPASQASRAPTEHDKKYSQAQCRTLREEEAWLVNPRNAGMEARDARLGQVRQALAGCRG